MSLHDYEKSLKLQNEPVEALLMAVMRKADMAYLTPLKAAFPSVYEELRQRMQKVGGRLDSDPQPRTKRRK